MSDNLEQFKTHLLEAALRHEPGVRTRSPLAPHQETVAVLRAKYLSYEKISKFFSARQCHVSPAAVGRFCRKYVSGAQVSRVRAGFHPSAPGAARPQVSPPTGQVKSFVSNPRGPKIARDDY